MFTKITKAFKELTAAGLVDATPWRAFGAQSAGCSPIATAYANGTDEVIPVRPTGIAKSLNIGNPADGPYALDVVRTTGGAMAAVDDEEIREGIRLLARTTGVFAETAGGVTTAVLKKLVESGRDRHLARDRHLQHRRRAEDDRRGERECRPDRSHPADGEGDARRRPAVVPASPRRPQ